MPSNQVSVVCENGNKVVDRIVKDKVSLCRQQNINFKIIGNFKNLCKLNVASIDVLFGNLLNGAIGMCINMPSCCNAKYINLMFLEKEIDCCEIIYIENSYNKKGSSSLTKGDVCAIKKEIGLYNGKFKERYNNDIHIIEIKFPICY